jgi:hypothetical protein
MIRFDPLVGFPSIDITDEIVANTFECYMGYDNDQDLEVVLCLQ